MNLRPWDRFSKFIGKYSSEITAIYFFAMLGGLLQLSVPIGIQAIVSLSIGAAWATSIYVLIILVVTAVLLFGLLQMYQMRLIERLQQIIFTDNAINYARKIPDLNLQAINNGYLPEQVSRFFETFQIQKVFSKILLNIPAASIQIIFGLILLGFYHPAFIIFGLGLLLVVSLIIRLTANPGLTSALEESNQKYFNTGWIIEMARVPMSLKLSGSKGPGLQKADDLVSTYLDKRNEHFKILLIQYKSLIAFKVLITAAMLSIGAVLLIQQKITIGEFVAAEIVILMVISAVEKLISSMDKIYDVATGLEKIESVLEAPSEKEGGYVYQPVHGGPLIEFRSFGFAFPRGPKVIDDLELTFRANSVNILHGRLGQGKSTLLRVLGNIYTDYSGHLLIDGVELKSHDLFSLRKHTGAYIHTREIFRGSLRENIILGRSEISDKEIITLMRNLGFDQLMQDFPDFLETMIDPAGMRLSSNKANKILLLRCLVGHPALILMDEPFLHLKQDEKEKVIQYLKKISEGCSIIIASDDDVFNDQAFLRHELISGKK